MTPVYDPTLGIRIGFFVEGKYVDAPDIDALISEINNSIREHQAAIIRMRGLRVLLDKLKEFEARSLIAPSGSTNIHFKCW